MSDDFDDLADLSRTLPAPDLDATTARRIALRAREDLGKGAPKRRWILPFAVGVPATAYGIYTLLRVLDLLR